MSRFRKSNQSKAEFFDGKHRYEHWYRDNTVYFITSRCRDQFPAFKTDDAKSVFWDRFNYYANAHGFTPWVTTLLDNHYHTIGYLRRGDELGEMMRKLHGSVAKLVNDQLGKRHLPFWREGGHKDYFDGCIRNELQARRAYRYVLTQSRRHGICRNPSSYPHTIVKVEIEPAVARSKQLSAFLEDLPYQRYERRTQRRCAEES